MKSLQADHREQEVHSRHILVETEDEAKAVKASWTRARISPSWPREVHRIPRVDGRSRILTKDQMVPEFSAVAFTLEPGKISDPVSRSSAGTSSRSRKTQPQGAIAAVRAVPGAG